VSWNDISGMDSVLVGLLRSYNSSPLISHQHRLQLRLQRWRHDHLTEKAIDIDGTNCHIPNLTLWSVPKENQMPKLESDPYPAGRPLFPHYAQDVFT
jgi:hypothetical protein